MKVAFVTNFIPPYRVSFFSKMAKLKGVDLLVIHGEVLQETGRPSARNHTDWKFNSHIIKNFEKGFGSFVLRWQSGVLPVLCSFKPDIIVILGISGTLSNWLILTWARYKRLHSMMWMCGWEAQEKNSISYYVKKYFLRLYVQLPSIILVYGTKAYNSMIDLGVPNKKCVVCYNGLDIEGSDNTSRIIDRGKRIRHELNPTGLPIFLYVGGILKEKKLDLLLYAFYQLKKNRKAKLWIIGDGPLLSDVKNLASSLGLSDVHFFGRIIDDVDSYFYASDFFVLPGIGGLALNQAMFWGSPCICSDADGTEDDLVINNETGFRFITNSVDSLNESLLKAVKIYKNDELYHKMTATSLELIKSRSNVNHMLDIFFDEFKKMTT